MNTRKWAILFMMLLFGGAGWVGCADGPSHGKQTFREGDMQERYGRIRIEEQKQTKDERTSKTLQKPKRNQPESQSGQKMLDDAQWPETFDRQVQRRFYEHLQREGWREDPTEETDESEGDSETEDER